MRKGGERVRFYGSHEHTVDTKGRVSLPAKFREIFPADSTLVLVKGLNDMLWVFDADQYEDWVCSLQEKNEDGSVAARRVDKLIQFLNASSDTVKIDGAGRIMLPQKLRDAVGLDRDVTILGNGDHVEVWPRQKFDEEIDLSQSLSSFLE